MSRSTRVTLAVLALPIALLALSLVSTAPVQAATSDETAEALMSSMRAKDYAAAFEMFDPRMKAAVSEEKLRSVWETQLATLGSLVSWTTVQRSQKMGLDIRIGTLKFERGELQSTIAIDPGKQLVAGFLLRPASPPAPPAPYIDSSKFRSVDVSIGDAPYVLGGTLTLPTKLDPVPGAILVHGSGPSDRDETIGANKVFKDLAEGLASRGIAVLRYDKRTYTYAKKLGDTISVDDEVTRDAVSALSALGARPEVDPKRLVVIGHSMGALLAPEIAMRSTQPAALVLLAPPGRAPWDLLLSQVRFIGMPPKEIADIERKVNLLKNGALGNERLLGAPQSYWRDLAARDGIGTARKFGKPVLILRGDRDYQVIEEDVVTWQKGLAGVPRIEVETMAGDNHLFIQGKGKPGPAEYEIPGHVDGRVIEKLASFIRSSTGVPERRQ